MKKIIFVIVGAISTLLVGCNVGNASQGDQQTLSSINVNGTDAVKNNLLGSGSASSLFSIAKGPNGNVAVGESGAIMYSDDGESWNMVTPVSSNSLYKVLYVASLNRYLAAGGNGEIISSQDGKTWSTFNWGVYNKDTNSIQTPSNDILDFIVNANYIIAVAKNNAIYVINAANPIQSASVQKTAINTDLKAIAISESGLISISAADGSLFYGNFNSATKVNNYGWNRATLFKQNPIQKIRYDSIQSLFLGVSESGYLVKSSDGVRWSSPIQIAKNISTPIVYSSNRGYFAIGVFNGLLQINYSSDLVSWSTETLNAPTPVNKAYDLECFSGSNDCFIAGNNDSILHLPESAGLNDGWRFSSDQYNTILKSGETITNDGGHTLVYLYKEEGKLLLLQTDGNFICSKKGIVIMMSGINSVPAPNGSTLRMKVDGTLEQYVANIKPEYSRPRYKSYDSGESGTFLVYNKVSDGIEMVSNGLENKFTLCSFK